MKYIEITASVKIPFDNELESLHEKTDGNTRDNVLLRLEQRLHDVIQAESDDDAVITTTAKLKKEE